MIDLNSRLAAAEAAYHDLMTGKAVVELRDQNGEQVRYSAVNASRLMGYILDLKRQLGIASSSAPMRAWF